MPIQFGDQGVTEVRYGSQNVTEIMYGGEIVFQSKKPFSYDFGFQDMKNLWWAPVTQFDMRTSVSAPRAPAWTFNDMLVAPDSAHPSYLGHLVNRQCDGDISFLVTTGDIMNTRARPSSVIIKSSIDQTQKIVADFGSDGILIQMVVNDGVVPLATYSRTISTGQSLEFNLVSGILQTRHQGTLVGSLDLTSYDTTGWNFFGFGVFSTSGQWSTRIQRIQISGATSFNEVPYASASARRLTLARETWVEIASVLINTSRTFSIQGSCIWGSTSTANRQTRILVGGSPLVAGSATSVYATSYTVGADQWVVLQALSSSSTTAQRVVSDGLLLLGDPL